MANIDTLDPSEKTGKEEGVDGVQDGKAAVESAGGTAHEAAAESKPSSPPKDGKTALPSPGSGLVPLRGPGTNGSTSTGSNAPTLSMPHPKKFSHSDINKRFLGKNSPASSVSQVSSTPTVSKPGSAIQKPVLQTAPSHSKLVTAKLTAEGQRPIITGPGWSRPPSTSSSSGPQPSATANANLASSSTPGAAPQPPPAGKVIQPQPRASAEGVTVKKETTSRPAWGAAKTPAAIDKPDLTATDFPTAAEVAQVRTARLLEKKQAAQVAAAHKEALAAEADAFRGVHLAPNAHHWDEDEGDDSNFLDEVIQFDDGRQYTIPHQQEKGANDLPSPSAESQSKQGDLGDRPVSKEERFADDFDRSWPRSKPRNLVVQQPQISPSSTSSHLIPHPQDSSSRVLFNERSNRLEPYSSHSQGRFSGPPRDSHSTRRGSRSEYVSSPTDMRGGRDAPPHTQIPHMQQRTNGGSPDELRRGFGEHGSHNPWHDSARHRDREPRRDFAGPSHMSRTYSQGFDPARSRDHLNPPGPPGESYDRQRRMSNVGPSHMPTTSSGIADALHDNRQLPPHLAESREPLPTWRSPSSEASRRIIPTSPSEPSSSQALPPHSQASVGPAALSPASVNSSLESQPIATPILDVDEARKVAMHNAAERARIRRQQEEAQREKEKERARKKAAEIEARLKATEDAKAAAEAKEEEPPKAVLDSKTEAQAVDFIQQAVQSVSLHEGSTAPRDKPGSASATGGAPPAFIRVASLRGNSRPPHHSSAGMSGEEGISATDAESWRVKPSAPHVTHEPPTKPPGAPAPTLNLLQEVETFDIQSGESVEVVDFADHGKLVGAHEPSPSTTSPLARSNGPFVRPPRPVAKDFFTDQEESSRSGARTEEGSWRRKASLPSGSEETGTKPKPVLEITPVSYDHGSAQAQWKGPAPADVHVRVHESHAGHHPPSHTSLRSPLTPAYREAPMAALTDTMARIKGALDGMHYKPEVPKKWLPPALRDRSDHEEKPGGQDDQEERGREVFDVTSIEPPRSPKPAWNHFSVRLPQTSRQLDSIPYKRLQLFSTRYHMRTEISSFVPPLEGPHRRDIQVNDVLFRKPFVSKGRVRYIVSIPRLRTSRNEEGQRGHGLVVNLPSRPAINRGTSSGAFGRPSEADGVDNWRKPSTLSVKASPTDVEPQPLDTVSRSPPPETLSQAAVDKQETTSLPAVSVPGKGRTQPKFPEGSAVAFYRDSRVSSGDSQPKPTVNFFVNSELEEGSRTIAPSVQLDKDIVTSPPSGALSLVAVAGSNHPIVPESCASKDDPIVEFHKGSHSPIHAPITPKSQMGNLPWSKSPKDITTKETAPRSADAEHIRTVWSSKANQADKSSVNTLERIADDLAGPYPVPVREGKLEELSVTAAHGSHPSKMSLSDVTRSFQQVPTPSGSSNKIDAARNTVTSPSSPPAARQVVPMASSQQPMIPVGMQQPFTGYPSPMLSSPSPNMMYAQAMTPSPIPRAMVPNTNSSQYPPAPMWVPMPPPPGMPAGMMRHIASPYGPQLMPYHPGTPMYTAPPPNMQGAPGSQPNGVANRPPGMVMSPVAAQAQANMPIYASSPVLMSAMPAMPGAAYPTPAGRGQPPPRGAYDNRQPMMQHPSSFGPQPPSTYSTGAPNNYLRW